MAKTVFISAAPYDSDISADIFIPYGLTGGTFTGTDGKKRSAVNAHEEGKHLTEIIKEIAASLGKNNTQIIEKTDKIQNHIINGSSIIYNVQEAENSKKFNPAAKKIF